MTSLTTVVTHRRIWGAIAIVLMLSICWGIPSYKRWWADKLVDELCAKDGGIKVYETVTLSANMFNEYGQPIIRFDGTERAAQNTSNSGLNFSINDRDIIGNHNSSDIGKLAVWQSIIRLYRRSDGKALGETIWYARSGGDGLSFGHPSSYSCPDNASEWDLANKVVTKINTK